jgi:hypothetical protein
MERSVPAQQEYASFLIRMWREVDPAAPYTAAEWHGEVEHIQSGQHSKFASEAELWEFLHQSLEQISSGKSEA